jgi:hypothetical protein
MLYLYNDSPSPASLSHMTSFAVSIVFVDYVGCLLDMNTHSTVAVRLRQGNTANCYMDLVAAYDPGPRRQEGRRRGQRGRAKLGTEQAMTAQRVFSSQPQWAAAIMSSFKSHTHATRHAQLLEGGVPYVLSQGDGHHPSQIHGSGRPSIGVRKRSSSNARVCWQRRFEEDHRMWGPASASRIKMPQADIPGGRASVSSIESTAFAREEPCSRPDHGCLTLGRMNSLVM